MGTKASRKIMANLLEKLIRSGRGRSQLFFASFALGVGSLLLLLSLQSFQDIRSLIYGANGQRDLANFLIINKEITNRMMGTPDSTFFTPGQIQALRSNPYIQSLGLITSNEFKVSASAGHTIPFSTDLFFESVPDSFLDILPSSWHWKPGDQVLPVILSSDFLSLYNFGFALSQGLPQLSEQSLRAIPVTITISGGSGSLALLGRIVGFSNRISSILVPQDFMDWANRNFGNKAGKELPSRLILKVRDPSSPGFTEFLNAHHYITRPQTMNLGKTRMILQTVVTVIGLFGLLILLLSLMILSIYIRLVISRSREEIGLLVTLGYSPAILARFLQYRTIPLFSGMILVTLLLVVFLQAGIHAYLLGLGIALPLLPSWSVFLLAILMLILVLRVNQGTIRSSVLEA